MQLRGTKHNRTFFHICWIQIKQFCMKLIISNIFFFYSDQMLLWQHVINLMRNVIKEFWKNVLCHRISHLGLMVLKTMICNLLYFYFCLFVSLLMYFCSIVLLLFFLFYFCLLILCAKNQDFPVYDSSIWNYKEFADLI